MKRCVYIISGPAGVGKTTTSKRLAKTLKNSAYLSGDYISHMHINGRRKPWESREETNLIWKNIFDLTKNFIDARCDVVIDYVAFPEDVYVLREKLDDLDVCMKYVVLWTNKNILMARDRLRKPEFQMGERCLILMEEFRDAEIDKNHIFDTSKVEINAIESVIHDIIKNDKYLLT